jgi:hypothetical protein
MPYHVLGDGGLGDLEAQLQQLAMDPRGTPARVVAAQHPNQIPNLLWHSGPTWLPTAYPPPPEQAEALPVPRDDHLSLDDQQSGLPVGVCSQNLVGPEKCPAMLYGRGTDLTQGLPTV